MVNISVKKPISEKFFATIIRSGILNRKYYAQIFAFFTELPIVSIVSFINKYNLSEIKLLKYYRNNVKKYYRNYALEEYLKYAK